MGTVQHKVSFETSLVAIISVLEIYSATAVGTRVQVKVSCSVPFRFVYQASGSKILLSFFFEFFEVAFLVFE